MSVRLNYGVFLVVPGSAGGGAGGGSNTAAIDNLEAITAGTVTTVPAITGGGGTSLALGTFAPRVT